MAIYYQVTAPGFEKNFDSKEKVCIYIRANKISEYAVYMKDDSKAQPKQNENGTFFPLQPMCENITSNIAVH